MLIRLILLVTAGALLIGGAFLWINQINDETKIAEDNNALPVKHAQKSPVNAGAPSASTTSVNTSTLGTSTPGSLPVDSSTTGAPAIGTTPNGSSTAVTSKTTNILTESIAGVPNGLRTHMAKLQDTIKNFPNQLMAKEKAVAADSSELTQAKLALTSRSAYAMPAITREQAAPSARESAGRADPMSPIGGFKPFPSSGGLALSKSSEVKRAGVKGDLIPPPPVGSIPPPPPAILAGTQGDSLPLNELPTPPERPSIAKHLKLVGILGDRAFMAVTDPYVRKVNRLPKTLAVSPGDRVDYLSVVAVSDSSVTLEEDGQRLVKHLASLR